MSAADSPQKSRKYETKAQSLKRSDHRKGGSPPKETSQLAPVKQIAKKDPKKPSEASPNDPSLPVRARHIQTKEEKEQEELRKKQKMFEITEVLREFSGSLERQNHPKSKLEEDNGMRSYLPKRFDVREMIVNRASAAEKIKENEFYLHHIDTLISGLEKDAASKVNLQD